MTDFACDEFIVCPTCGHVEWEEDEDGHLQPCPGCGFTQMAVRIVLWEDRAAQVTFSWDPGEGAQLFLADVAKATKIANNFIDRLETEEHRIDEAITEMRLERQQEEDV